MYTLHSLSVLKSLLYEQTYIDRQRCKGQLKAYLHARLHVHIHRSTHTLYLEATDVVQWFSLSLSNSAVNKHKQ